MTDAMQNEFSDKQIAVIMEAIGRKEIDVLVLSKVRDVAQSFLESRAEPTKARFAESKSKLALISKKAAELQALLDDLDPETLLYFDTYAISPDLTLGNSFIRDTGQALEDLQNKASEALQHVPQDIGGRERDEALSMLAHRLYRVFFEATGQQPTHTSDPKQQHYTSRFDRFVFTIALALDPDAGERAVADAIGRAIKLHKAKIPPDIG